MQGISAEVIAREWGLAREALDAYSLESHRRAVAATDEGRFDNEIVPIELDGAAALRPSRTGGGAAVAAPVRALVHDETPRRDTSAEKLAGLAPAFIPDGVVTAGNSSQICDGAAAVLLASEAAATRLGLEPRGRFVSFGLAGVDPHRMLHGNPQACAKALGRGGPDLGRHRGDRGERGVRVGRAAVRARRRARGPLGTTSTRTAAASRSATRSALPARG